jgi:signal transduction histidine kinase
MGCPAAAAISRFGEANIDVAVLNVVVLNDDFSSSVRTSSAWTTTWARAASTLGIMPDVHLAVAALRRSLKGPLADWLLAAAFTVGAEVEALLTVSSGLSWRPVVAAVAGLGMLSLAARRRLPLLPIAVIGGLALIAAAAGGDSGSGSGVRLLATFVSVYSLGAYGGRLQLLVGLPIPLAVVAALDMLRPTGFSLAESLSFIALFVIGLPALAGRIVRDRRELVHQLEEQTSELRAERSARARRALGVERTRISHELNQVVTSTVRRLLAQLSTAEAATSADGLPAVTEVEDTAREGLSEMRQLLSVISQPDGHAGVEAGGLEGALTRASLAGIRIVRSGLADAHLATPVELAASRAVELYLDDAACASEIEITRRPTGLELVFRGSGWEGLGEATVLALRERVSLAAGALGETPSDPSPGIRVWLPFGSAPVPTLPVPPLPVATSTGGRPPAGLGKLPWPALLAATFYILLEVEIQTSSLLHGSRLLNLLAGVAVAAPLAWCRGRPLIAAGVSLLAAIVTSITLTPIESMAAAAALYLVLPFSVAAFRDRLPALAGLVICGAAVFVPGLLRLPGFTSIPDAASIAPFVLGAWVAGRLLQGRSRLARELRETNRLLAEERDASAREVVMAERARVARELHDVVGHSLTVIVLQAGAARRVWLTDRATALTSLANAGRVARGALTELLQGLDVLDATDQPARDVAGIEVDGLVEMARLAGAHLEIRVEGERARLSPPAQLASYRVVQEALTNAVKHAPGRPVLLVIHYRQHAMELRVSNDRDEGAPAWPAAHADGHGLPGMRQRVAACGGRLEWGAGEGTFWVLARLPVMA